MSVSLKLNVFYCTIIFSYTCSAAPKNPPLPYDEWTYVFVYPSYLPAQVTYVRFLDTDGYLNQNYAPDLTTADSMSVNAWRKIILRSTAIANKGKMPPQWMQICWKSFVDKKVYQTTLEFPSEVWKLMRQPIVTPLGDYYRNNMVIGVAPEGKVRAWFNTPDINGGENIQIAEGKTVNGNDLTFCKNFGAYKGGYKLSAAAKKFVEGKTYPYGKW